MKAHHRAATVQAAVRKEEEEQREIHLYDDDDHVHQSIIHTREDMVLVVSHLLDINKRVGFIRWLLVIVIVLLVGIAGLLSETSHLLDLIWRLSGR